MKPPEVELKRLFFQSPKPSKDNQSPVCKEDRVKSVKQLRAIKTIRLQHQKKNEKEKA